MKISDISEAKANLPELVGQVLNIQDTSPRTLGAGQWKGKIWMADDFDDLPVDLLKLFTGKIEDHKSST